MKIQRAQQISPGSQVPQVSKGTTYGERQGWMIAYTHSTNKQLAFIQAPVVCIGIIEGPTIPQHCIMVEILRLEQVEIHRSTLGGLWGWPVALGFGG